MNRDGLLNKIRALMSKTVGNGCSEHEALAALDKARAMMDAYEVTEEDLKLSTSESAVLLKEPPGSRDPHKIKSSLAVAVARFCDCKVWREDYGHVFCGLQSDVQFATWLIDTLAAFVQAELARHLMGSIVPKGERRFIINGFVSGCGSRISERLTELYRKSEVAASTNGHALVVVKGAAIAEKMKELNLNLRQPRRSSRRINVESYRAGKSAGDHASFGRPVSSNAGISIPKGAHH